MKLLGDAGSSASGSLSPPTTQRTLPGAELRGAAVTDTGGGGDLFFQKGTGDFLEAFDGCSVASNAQPIAGARRATFMAERSLPSGVVCALE